MPRCALFSKCIFDHVHQVLRRQLVPVAQSGDPLDKGAGDRDVGHLAEEAFAAPLSAPDADAVGEKGAAVGDPAEFLKHRVLELQLHHLLSQAVQAETQLRRDLQSGRQTGVGVPVFEIVIVAGTDAAELRRLFLGQAARLPGQFELYPKLHRYSLESVHFATSMLE